MGGVPLIARSILLTLALLPQTSREQAVRLAIETLAHDLGLATDLVELQSVSPVDWPDTSLGCPSEVELHAQVITPGFRISLQVDGQMFSVHTGGGRAVVCRKEEAPRDEPESPELLEMVARARKDLADQLDVEPDAIELIAASEVVWPNESMGCPAPGKVYSQRTVEGFFIRLRFQSRVYRYHAARDGMPFLCERAEAP
jgi:hypothetical protein